MPCEQEFPKACICGGGEMQRKGSALCLEAASPGAGPRRAEVEVGVLCGQASGPAWDP